MNTFGSLFPRQAGRFGPHIWLPLLWLLIAAAFIALVLRAEFQRIERDLARQGEAAREHVHDALRNNEAVLEGFAAMLETLGERDWQAAGNYAQRMLRQYPHIYMLEVAQRVGRDRLAAFEAAQRLRHPGYTVRAFSYLTDRKWRPAAEQSVHYPLVFAAPMSPAASQILGLDIASVPFLSQAMRRCSAASPFAASHPFQLVEGGRAYVLHRFTHADARVLALLVVKTEALLARDLPGRGKGIGYRLWHRDFAADDPLGVLTERPRVAAGVFGWLAPMQVTHAVECAGQHFLLRVEKGLSWADFDWLLLGSVFAMASLIFALLLVYGRIRLREEASQRRYAEELLHMAQHDALTGLPNRSLLMDRLGQAMARANRNHHRFALLFMDVDHFKQVNDTHGHAMGDQLLRTIGHTLLRSLRAQDTVSRISGDEFVVILEPVGQREHAQAIARKLSEAVHTATRALHSDLSVAISSGLAIYPNDADSAEGLMKQADSDMYANKQARSGG